MRRRVVAAALALVSAAATDGTYAAALVEAGDGDGKAWCENVAGALSVQELSSDMARGARPRTTPVRFIIAMMGPRVGSKMVRSMLEKWGGGDEVVTGGARPARIGGDTSLSSNPSGDPRAPSPLS